MRCWLPFILSFGACLPVSGQEIDKIVITVMEFDDRVGDGESSVEYLRNKSGDLVATNIIRNHKKETLKSVVKIDRERALKYCQWRKEKVNRFLLSELNLEEELVRKRALDSTFKTHFTLPDQLIIRTDSFDFCQRERWRVMVHFRFSYETWRIEVIMKSGEKDTFEFEPSGREEFDLKGYIYAYQLVSGRIPIQIHHADIFGRDNLITNMMNYFQMIECEGYYYQEFLKGIPKRTPMENRMMIGWNFVEYMNHRNKKVLKDR